MQTLTRRKFVPAALALLVSTMTGCGGRRGYSLYPTRYGTYTVVRRPVIVVDPWTGRALRRRRYRRYRIRRRRNSPEVVYTATHEDSILEVKLTPMGDETRIEVTARNGEDNWDPEEARTLLDHILENDN